MADWNHGESAMKIGFHTITWGIQLDDIESTLDVIAEAGYQGVEFAQRPDVLRVKDSEELRQLLAERNLVLIGLVGGTLTERMEFFGNVPPEYLYVDDADPKAIPSAVKKAAEKGFTLAVHPRMFMPVSRLSDARPLLEEHPKLKLLPDTAHLTIADDDPAAAILYAKDRLAAVHLKDWTPEFGRSSHRYGRGFTELGKGIVDLDSVLRALRQINYDGWVVVEVDSPRISPKDSAVACAEWLAERGLLPSSKPTKSSVASRSWVFPSRHGRKCNPEAEARFRESVMLAGTKGIETFYERIAAAFKELIPCKLIAVWTCSPTQDHLGLLAVTPHVSLGNTDVLQISETLSGIAIDRRAPITRFDLTEKRPGQKYGDHNRRFGHPDLLKKLELKQMVTVPIYNIGNHNYVRLIVNLFPHDAEIPVTDEELYWFGRAVTAASDSMLDRLFSFAVGSINLLAGRCKGAMDFLEGLKNLIQERLNCEGVSIFLVNDMADKLELATTTGTEWLVPKEEQFYRKDEGLTGKVWHRNEPLLTVDIRQEPGQSRKSAELVQTQDRYTGLWVPFVDARGKVVGVVQCLNKRLTQTTVAPNMFSDDDAAVLDAIGQAAVPHLVVLLEERRAKALGRLTHELKTPLVAIRGAAEFMLRTKGVDKFFDYDYPGDVWSWSELMRRLFGNADLFQYSSENLPIQATPTLLRADVIAPAVRQVNMLLRERNFSPNRIGYGLFAQIPHLWIDRNQFQQVMFNLLSNAIKYCDDNPGAFRVDIFGMRQGGKFLIRFQDQGPGIQPGMEDIIFEEGVRGPDAIAKDVTGQGLGLWVARQVVEAHGGRVKVTNLRRPTEFTIYLPESLADGSPMTDEKGVEQ